MSGIARYLPWGIAALAACILGFVALPPRAAESSLQIYEFGKLPVMDQGRVKPVDTLARLSLVEISGRQTFRDDRDGPEKAQTVPAVKWLLDLITGEKRDAAAMKQAWGENVFLVENDTLRQIFQLPQRPGALYSLEELAPHLKQIFAVAVELENKDPERLNPPQRIILDLAKHVRLYIALAGRNDKVFRITNDQLLALLNLEPRSGSGYRYAASEFITKLGPLLRQTQRARQVEESKRDLFDLKVLELANHLSIYVQLSEPERLCAVPPAAADEEWKALGNADKGNAVAQAWLALITAYEKDQPRDFNRAVADCEATLANTSTSDVDRTRFEAFYNHFDPFTWCAWLYVLVFVLACLGLIPGLQPLQRSAFWLGILTLVVHSAALLARMYLTGRWFVFVMNLYSSAVFIGWICVIMALVLQRVFNNGIGNLVAGLTGFTTLMVAMYLRGDGDSLGKLQAVLDTDFWLATHVTSITIGYAATFLAGFLGWVYIGAGVLTPLLIKEAQKALTQMIYGILCFATLFSFTGTVLGGIWADQSWGRFWGWDPKENGALLIVLWNALILHARWGGLVKQRGIAVLAVVGNMVTGWSWFGTNQLGVGLHAYGFNNTLALGLTTFWMINLTFIGMGLLPRWMWQSFRPRLPPSRSAPPAAPSSVMKKS